MKVWSLRKDWKWHLMPWSGWRAAVQSYVGLNDLRGFFPNLIDSVILFKKSSR